MTTYQSRRLPIGRITRAFDAVARATEFLPGLVFIVVGLVIAIGGATGRLSIL